MFNVKVKEDGSEIISYDEEGIPIYIREGDLSAYPDYRALCHWHEDIELIYILDGSMNYYINGKNILLTAGDSLVVNSGRLHYGYSDLKEECHFYCMLLHPSLLTTNEKLIRKYVSVITRSSRDYVLFGRGERTAELICSMYELKKNPPPFYEMEIIRIFQKLWRELYQFVTAEAGYGKTEPDEELLVQRKMVSFIYRNYGNHITLDEIAASGSICRSKCCRIFKRYAGQSPMEFVNSYRLEKSRKLLLTTQLKVTDICMACGFNHLSYFTKQFAKRYGCTPRELRKSMEGIS